MLISPIHIAVSPHERLSAPTYATSHRVLSGDASAPMELAGWTALRAMLIAPGLALAGIRGRQLVIGSLAASSMVSIFALWRSYTTKNT